MALVAVTLRRRNPDFLTCIANLSNDEVCIGIAVIVLDDWGLAQLSTVDPTLADAILDPLVNNAHHLKLKGESMRKQTAALQEADRLRT